MPNDLNSSDPFFSPEPAQGTTPAASGEFTQVFASIAPPPKPDGRPLAFAASNDDFTKVFSTIPSTVPAGSTPPAPASLADEATLVFEQVRIPPAAPTPLPVPAATRTEAAPSQPPAPVASGPSEFDQVFSPAASPQGRNPEPAPISPGGEFTQIFSAVSLREASSSPVPARQVTQQVASPQVVQTQQPAAPQAPSSDGFTQLFQQAIPRVEQPAPQVLPPPAAFAEQPPSALPLKPVPFEAPPSAMIADAGSFTQMFQQVQPPVEAPVRAAQPPVAPAVQTPFAPSPSQAAAPSAPPPVASEAGSFTQMFQQIQPPAVPAAPTPVMPPSPAAPAAADPGSFTQMFQQIQPPPSAPPLAVTPPPPAPAPPRSVNPPQPAADAWPAFGPPAQAPGTFTDVFAARPEARAQPAAPAPPASAQWPASQAAPPVAPPQQWPASQPASQGEGFTQLFQSVPAAPPAPGNNFFGSPASDSPWPQSQSPSFAQSAPPAAAGGGDFTRLMNSLASPSPGASVPAPGGFAQGQPSQQPSMQNDAFFGSGFAGGAPAESSEFTRVLRGSAQREGSPSAPVAPGPAAPALAAPAKKEEAVGKAPEKKSKTLVILLVVMNVLLVLALIVIGYFVMRHK